MHIIPLGHQDIAVNLGEQGAAAGKIAPLVQVRVELKRRQVLLPGAVALDCDITEAVIGKGGLPEIRVSAAAGGNVAILLPRAPQVGQIQRAVFIKQLHMGQGNALARRQTAQAKAHHAGDILAKVGHI